MGKAVIKAQPVFLCLDKRDFKAVMVRVAKTLGPVSRFPVVVQEALALEAVVAVVVSVVLAVVAVAAEVGAAALT